MKEWFARILSRLESVSVKGHGPRPGKIPNARSFAFFLPMMATSALAQPEIHRCEQPDGTIAFQETPCPETPSPPEAADSTKEDSGDVADDFFEFENPFDSPPEEQPESSAADDRPISEERALCEKQARDAIDEIDLEIRRQYSPEQRDEYLARLRVLTQQLRACQGYGS